MYLFLWHFVIFFSRHRSSIPIFVAVLFVEILKKIGPLCPGGGGGTQMLFGRGCAAEASKLVPIFKGHFGGKGYPLLGIFSQENDVFVYFSDKMGENI